MFDNLNIKTTVFDLRDKKISLMTLKNFQYLWKIAESFSLDDLQAALLSYTLLVVPNKETGAYAQKTYFR